MAPPSPRRPGFSRRAQYSIFATYLVAIVGALIALLLAVTARLDPSGHSAVQSIITDITTPIANAGRAVLSGFGDAGESTSAYFNAASKNKAMKKELAEARQKIIKGEAEAQENKRLKQLLGIRDAAGGPVISARLVASTGTISHRYATLAAGSSSGVTRGMTVRTVEGLIGRVVNVGIISSRVLLIIDGERTTPAKRASDGLPAMLVGRGDGLLEVRPLIAGPNPFKVGDVLVTSGTGGIYRPGLPVAKVLSVSQSAPIARPSADPAGFDFALVEPIFIAPPPPPAPPAGEEGKPPPKAPEEEQGL